MTIERASGHDPRRMTSSPDDFDDEFNDAGFLDAGDDEWLTRPEWLPADCQNVGFALEVATCCKNPDNPLVGCAVDLADLVDVALGRLVGFDCKSPAAELAYLLKLIPGLLAQIHAILPRLNPTALAQLICPIGRLANAVDQACLYAARGRAVTPASPTGDRSSASSGPCCRTVWPPSATASAGRSPDRDQQLRQGRALPPRPGRRPATRRRWPGRRSPAAASTRAPPCPPRPRQDAP